MNLFANYAYQNDARKIERALKAYEAKKTIVFTQLTEIEMLEKLPDGQSPAERKKQLMKENLIALERKRRELVQMLNNHIDKYKDRNLSYYLEKLEELEDDKPA